MDQNHEPVVDEGPIESFSNCHGGILQKLQGLTELPALLAPAARARELSESAIEFLREAIFEHHLDEERELFPAVLNAARSGEERSRVEAMVARLTEEHRGLEALWKRLEADLKQIVKGHFDELDIRGIEQLATSYQAHAQFEEAEFLPLSREILGRHSAQMADLALSVHLRHAPAKLKRLT